MRRARVRAQYLIGADGTQSAVREAVGIRRHGPGILQHWMNVIFEADLPSVIDGRAIRSVFVTDINGTLVPRGDGRWLMAVQFVPDRGERVEDFTPEHCRDLIRRGAGRADLKVDIVDVRPWEAAAAVADRYQEGRVLLVGDSAHVMPPTGGFGGNTGIQDAYNLAWKLEAVVNGAARPELLETYDAERRPIADRTVAQSLARLQAWFKDPSRKLPPPEPIRDDNAVIFGYRYPAGAFVDDGRNGTDDLFEDPRNPSGRPGSRAPHLVVTHGGAPVSTIDLFADRWVLISGRDGNGWSDCVRRSSAARALGVVWHGIQPAGDLEDVANRFSTAYGVGTDGAVLIRPDGFIAWRHATAADGASPGRCARRLDRTAVNTGGHMRDPESTGQHASDALRHASLRSRGGRVLGHVAQSEPLDGRHHGVHFLEVGHTMIGNLGGPMAVLMPATLVSALPVLARCIAGTVAQLLADTWSAWGRWPWR